MKQHKFRNVRGQALVEFALIITVLLMMIFLMVESARIMWGWGTVQHAAREGARYATTGQYDTPNCAVAGLAKFNHLCNPTTGDLRTASIISVTHNGLSGLPIDDNAVRFEDDNYYNIEIWGVDLSDQLEKDSGGAPNKPVVVRVTYRVPIITPFFRPLVASIPLYGQVTMTNESFGQLGTANQGVGAAPPLPPLPTPGPTPTFTPTPTPTPSPTAGPTSTPTATPTNTPTSTPVICPVQFEGIAIENDNFVFVTGDVGTTATIIDLTNGLVLGTDTLLGRGGHACPGFAAYSPPNQLRPRLIAGHVILVQSSDGSFDTTIVVQATPTPTPTATNTRIPTATPTNTPTIAPTSTPSGPFIYLSPNCQGGPNVQFSVFGFNWPTNQSVALLWEGNVETIISAPHTGSFQQTWSKFGLGNGGISKIQYRVTAQSASFVSTAIFQVPCDNATPVPVTATPTSTPQPADLIIVGMPRLVSTPPIVAYRPVQYQMTISNTGDIDVSSQFFIDLYFDPATPPAVGVDVSIPISQSVGYAAISSLTGQSTRVVTITAQIGFANSPTTHQIYGMVDSVQQIVEGVETNNISAVSTLTGVTPAPTPTATPTTVGALEVSGVVRALIGNWIRQPRAVVKIWNGTTLIASTTSDVNGFYQFLNVPPGSGYSVTACVLVDNTYYYGQRTGITPPDPYAAIFMIALAGGCP